MQKFVSFLKPLVIGIVGCLLALTIWHLYQDHIVFHQLLNFVIESQQKAAQK